MDALHIFEDLRRRFSGTLPGTEAQFRMAPVGRQRPVNNQWDIPADARKSAVLVLFILHEGALHLPLIRRPSGDAVHAGQVSFPGGRTEETDASWEHTALREAREEIGVDEHIPQLAGRLSQVYIPPSNFLVQPVVAFTKELPRFTPQQEEVDEILLIRLEEFSAPGARTMRHIPVRGDLRMHVPCFEVRGHIIWGATAMMLSELLEALEREN